MNYRHVTILASEAASTAGTKTIDVDLTDPVSRIEIRFKGTNSTSTPTAHPAKMISKIEMVDGSDTLFSLSGIECQALNFYEEGRMPFNINETESGVECCATYHVNFGRFLGDEMLAFDPNKFRNPQLKITHNKASGGSAPSAGTLYVGAYVFDEKRISPSGFLTAKEHFAYSLTSSAKEQVNMPTDMPIRKMLVQSLFAGSAPGAQYNKLKLYENEGKRVVINDESTSELLKVFDFSPACEDAVGTLGTGSAVTFYVAPTYECYYSGVGRSASQTTLIVAQGSGGSVAVTNDASESVQVMVRGKAPHGALQIPFGKQDEIADWYDVTKLGSLKLQVTAGSSVGSGSTCEIVTQQFRRY